VDANGNGKAPSNLAELKKLIDSVDDGQNDLTFQWLNYTYEQLLARKTYHKKQQLKRKLMMKVASELLSQDELEAIDTQADTLAEKEIA
jgi:hypothetical protein